ncbi:MAG: hypothetical protein RL186_701 [Pseudomonadota bacterium]
MQQTNVLASSPRKAQWPFALLWGVLGLMVGVGSAWAVAGGLFGAGKTVVGGWASDPMVGAQAANPWLRARIARVGLLGLTKSETLYFERNHDDDGAPLRETCRYRLSGSNLPARWWSVTLYGSDQYLARNTDMAPSIDATRVAATGKEQWSAIVASKAPTDGNLWLSSRAGGRFSLTLRLYNPNMLNLDELAKYSFPKIERISCDAAGGGVTP